MPTPAPGPAPVYSLDRVRRLRAVLSVVLVLAALLGIFSIVLLTRDDGRAGGVLGLVIAVLLGGSGASAVRLLSDAERPAKVACVVTGLLTVVSGIALVGTWLALLLPLVGVGLVFMAIVQDPEA